MVVSTPRDVCEFRVYRTFCCSVFGFLWQIDRIPPSARDAELWALRRLAPGPGNWVRPTELTQLKHRYGHPFEFPAFHDLAMSAKLRVLQYEPQMDWRQYEKEFTDMIASAGIVSENWKDWYLHGPIPTMLNARAQAEHMGITATTIRSAIIGARGPGGSVQDVEMYVKHKFQAQALRSLVEKREYNHEHVIRSKLRRWQLAFVPAGILARRAIRVLQHAFELVPCRVACVLFRTWFNGWCTARRFQKQKSVCLLGCTAGQAEGCHDCIEHYSTCQVVVTFASRWLHMTHQFVGSRLNFLCLDRDVDDDARTLQLLLLHAVYSSTNCLRASLQRDSHSNIYEMLLQFVHQGASQSSAAQSVVHQALQRGRAVRRRVAM